MRHCLVVCMGLALLVGGCATRTIHRSYALLEQGQLSDAEYLLTTTRYQDNPYIRLNLGATYDRQGRVTEAQPLYESVLRLPDATPTKHSPFIAGGMTLHAIARYNLAALARRVP